MPKDEIIKIFDTVKEIQTRDDRIRELEEILHNINTSDGETTTPVLDLVNKNKELQQRIDKVIEYIEKGSYKDLYNIKSINEILKILKEGDDNE